MFTRRLAAIGIYPTATQAEVGVDVLIETGFNSAGIFLMLPKRCNTRPNSGRPPDGVKPQRRHSKSAAVTALGATGGAALFGALGVLAGAGAFGLPSFAPLAAAGALWGGIIGLGVGGGLGALAGAVLGLRLQEDRTNRYVTDVAAAPTMLVVNCQSNDEVLKAKAALARSGAEDVSSSDDPGAPTSLPGT